MAENEKPAADETAKQDAAARTAKIAELQEQIDKLIEEREKLKGGE